ncbi:hypothetical protein BDB01DRAFT_560881 [Pilobolus umbonatus]|nr:hypothetical protein BDB01DRAFT_560881 [Pilobolus umbonatus]
MDSPRLILRTYRANDHAQVDHLFYSTYFSLVPEGVKIKLKSPLFWVFWIACYAYLLAIIPVLLAGMNFPSWTDTLLKVFFTFSWAVLSFAGVFVITDRFEAVDKVEQARQNDLSDPETYYLNWIKEEVEVSDESASNDGNKKRVTFDKDAKPATEIMRRQKPVEEQSPSHFWVLELDNKVCGMVGLAHYTERLISRRSVQPPAWKLILISMFRRYGLPLPEFLKDLHSKLPVAVFGEPHEPHVATLQRLAVKTEYQECGLSSLLIDRAMSWAHEKGLTSITAVTNEFEGRAAEILKKKHGFKLVKKEKKGWFGQYEKTWSCDVEEWMKRHEATANKYFHNKDATDSTS